MHKQCFYASIIGDQCPSGMLQMHAGQIKCTLSLTLCLRTFFLFGIIWHVLYLVVPTEPHFSSHKQVENLM